MLTGADENSKLDLFGSATTASRLGTQYLISI